jgi:hypothetical protein
MVESINKDKNEIKQLIPFFLREESIILIKMIYI